MTYISPKMIPKQIKKKSLSLSILCRRFSNQSSSNGLFFPLNFISFSFTGFTDSFTRRSLLLSSNQFAVSSTLGNRSSRVQLDFTVYAQSRAHSFLSGPLSVQFRPLNLVPFTSGSSVDLETSMFELPLFPSGEPRADCRSPSSSPKQSALSKHIFGSLELVSL